MYYLKKMIILLSLTAFSLFPKIIHMDSKVTFVKEGNSKKSLISFVKIDNNNYIIKQKKNNDDLMLSVIKDALAAWIANILNISHSIEIIPAGFDIKGKYKKEFPATLHTIAPGCEIKNLLNHRFKSLSLKQFIIPHPKAHGQLGLTKAIITQMTWHKQIPLIIALDLFIGNWGRHNGNLFYDEKTDSFCMIDMDHAYEREIASFAINNLVKMIRSKIKFSISELEALKTLLITLELLLKNYPSKKIKKQLKIFIEETGFKSGTKIYSEQVDYALRNMNTIIDQNEANIYSLIFVLKMIIT